MNTATIGHDDAPEHPTGTTPHRETAHPDTVPVADYERVVAENDALRTELAAARKATDLRKTFGEFSRGIAWFAVALVVTLGLGYGVWFVAFRGEAWGEKARQNAEREAAAYVARRYGVPPAGVVCAGDDDPLPCVVRTADPRVVLELRCDDDDPVTNDGCEPVSTGDGVKPIEMVPFVDAGR